MGAWLTALAGFLNWGEIVKWVLRGVTFGKMVLINGTIILISLAYFYAIYESIKFIYDKTNYIINYINNFTGLNGEVANLAIDVFKSIGAWNAFVDVFVIFRPVLVGFFVIYGLRLGLKAALAARNTLLSFTIARL